VVAASPGRTTTTTASTTAKYGIIAMVVAAALLLSSLVLVPYLTTNNAIQSDTERRIIAYDTAVVPKETQDGVTNYEDITNLRYVKVGDLDPNSSTWVFNPFDNVVNSLLSKRSLSSLTEQEKGDILSKIDRYAFYQLIRLPTWLGGEGNSTSAYRLYNAISITQKCLAKYWPQEGRVRLEDPCAGDIYRPWDGLAYAGPAGMGFSSGFINSQGHYQGLSTLELVADSDGYIRAKRPDTSPHANGVPGEGRVFSYEELKQSDQEMMDSVSHSIGYKLPILSSIPTDRQLNFISISHNLGNYYYDFNSYWTDSGNSSPVIVEAVYSGVVYPEGSFISSTLVDSVSPALSLGSILNGTSSPSSSYNGKEDAPIPNLNNTVLRTILELDPPSYDSEGCYYNSSMTSGDKIPYSVTYGHTSGVAGEFSIIHAPLIDTIDKTEQSSSLPSSTNSNEHYSCLSTALIWGKSADGNGSDILVLVQVEGYDQAHLQSLVRELPIK
jgi:hypothetical protein